jgi:peptidyl-prolyl cis-trans isomerase D
MEGESTTNSKLININLGRSKVNKKSVAFTGALAYIFFPSDILSQILSGGRFTRMAIMTRMRDSMPAILIGLVGAFLIMIVFEWGMNYVGMRGGGHGETIGEVNGKKISYKEFSEFLRTASENQKAQTGKEPDDTQLSQLREQVWESMVTQELLNEQIRKLGVTVTDQELNDWVRGDNPPEDLRRNFVDSTGNFRRDLYEQFLNNPNQFLRDPQGVDQTFGTKWLVGYEKNLRQRRLQEKLQSIVLASVRVAPGEVLQRYKDQNMRYQVFYALLDANQLVKDNEVQVTDADLRSYYDENLDQFKFEASRKLQYVMFDEAPSGDDSAVVRNDIEDVAAKARAGVDFLQLVYTYSENPDSGAFFKHGELSPALEAEVFSAKTGDVVGPVLDREGYHLMKILDERKSSTEYVRASHILLSLSGQKDTNEVKALARQLVKEVHEGKDFAALAEQYSEDPGSASKGGDLGWFSRGRMVKPFEDAAFSSKPGDIVGPVRTSFGLHIIKVTGRDSREVKIATIRMPIRASSQTKNDIFQRAADFGYNAKESGFVNEAERSGFSVRETQVTEKAGVVPGIGTNERIIRWAFDNGVGSVSEPFTLPNGYVVLNVQQVINAGVRPFDEVKQTVRPQALRQKKIEKVEELARGLKAQLGPADSLTRISQLNPQVNVERSPEFTLENGVPGIGREPHFLGAVSGLSVGEISPPVETFRGAFLIQLLHRTAFDSSAFQTQENVLRTQMLQDKRNRFLSEWIAKLKEDADIEDHRDVFFR